MIDFHTHIFPDNIATATIDKLSKAADITAYTDGSASGLLASMDSAGVTASVVLPVVTNPGKTRHINESQAALSARFPGRIIPFGGIHPDTPDMENEFRFLSIFGFRGIKIHPVYQACDICDPKFLRILELAGKYNLTVVTHAGLDIGFPGVEHCSPAMVRNALRQVGPVRLVLAHMGGWMQWNEVLSELRDMPVYLDTSFSFGPVLSRSGEEKSGCDLLDTETAKVVVKTFGADRILFGSDSPWGHQKKASEALLRLDLPEDDMQAILQKNAEKLLYCPDSVI